MPRRTLPALAAIAIAACALALPTLDAHAALVSADQPLPEGHVLLQVFPAGEFMPSDGRKMDSPAWRIDAASAADVIERFRARGQPAVVDYEHQTLHKEANGQPAPAAAWMRDLRWIDGHGLFAVTELTARARAAIDAREYLYFSPVFAYDKGTGVVQDLFLGAVTNNPAIHGMRPLSDALIAAATAAFLPTTEEPPPMNELLKALLAALGLPAETTEQSAIAALTALGPLTVLRDQAQAARAALALPADANAAAVVAACTSLRATASPDPTQFVPIALLNEARGQVAALTAQLQTGTVDQQIEAALADGRLTAGPLEAYARDIAKTQGVAALTAFVSALPAIPALKTTQTQGKPPAGAAAGAAELSKDELAVCTQMGLTPDQFRAARPQVQAAA